MDQKTGDIVCFSWRVPSQCLYIRLYFKKICGLFMDRGGNMVSKIPSNALSQVKFKGRKIIIPYNGKRYVIVRCKNDNEKDVQEMLQFYHLV